MLAHFRVKGQHFLSPCAKLKNNIAKRNFGIGVLKQFGTTYECPIFSLKINPPYWEDSESHWWRSGLYITGSESDFSGHLYTGSNLMVYVLFNLNFFCSFFYVRFLNNADNCYNSISMNMYRVEWLREVLVNIGFSKKCRNISTNRQMDPRFPGD